MPDEIRKIASLVHTLGVLRSSFDRLQLSRVKISLLGFSLKPIGGRGALAGEFVSAAYGTTSGAWDSGVRAAECVVGLGGCAESDSAAGVPPTDRLLVVLALAVAVLA